jgi:acetolactate synthase-1/2/3 large subunit
MKGEPMSTTVEVLVEAFKECGTPFIVGHPGGESVDLMEAARAIDMRFILMKQESAGAILAGTWGEITGSPGVCISTRAPGAANMVNGVSHAWMDRCPLIAITDQYAVPTYETGLRQRLNALQLYTPITKWNGTLHASTVRQQIRRGIRTSIAPPQGPVQFDLPANETRLEAADLPAPAPLTPDLPALRPDRDSLKPALQMIGQSRRPIILAGLGILRDGCALELVSLAERLSAPVLTTGKAKGVIPEDHPLHAGVQIGGLIERNIISQADLIIAIGLDAVELQPKPWPYSAPVLGLSNTPSLDALVPVAPELVGRLGPIIGGLAQWAREGDGWGEKAARHFREELAIALDLPSDGLSPQRLVEITRNVMPRETIATVDTGASRLLALQKWQAYKPLEFFTSNGLATMGYSIPAGMAARLAYPDRPIVCFTGDGGFMMNVADLQTCAQEDLPLTIVVFDDQEIGLIRVKQEIRGLPRHGISLTGIKWDQLAAGLNVDGTAVDSENGLADALQEALKSSRTTIIGARIDKSCYVSQFNALREL